MEICDCKEVSLYRCKVLFFYEHQGKEPFMSMLEVIVCVEFFSARQEVNISTGLQGASCLEPCVRRFGNKKGKLLLFTSPGHTLNRLSRIIFQWLFNKSKEFDSHLIYYVSLFK